MPEPWKDLLRQGESSTHFIVEGRQAVQSLINSPYHCDALISTGATITAPTNIPSYTITKESASEILGFHFHRGHLAIGRKSNFNIRDWWQAPQLITVVPELADPGNLGTILRNSLALGADAILCGNSGTSPYNAKAIRAAAGATFQLPLFVSSDISKDLSWLAKRSQLIAASPSSQSVSIEDIKIKAPISLLLGKEDTGLHGEYLDYVDTFTKIPMHNAFDSLNVANSSAILLYELRKKLNVSSPAKAHVPLTSVNSEQEQQISPS